MNELMFYVFAIFVIIALQPSQNIEVEINKRISYNWKYEGYDGDSFVHFELFPDGEGTKVKLTTEIIEDFPQDIPEFKIESCIGGWKYFINKSLPQYIESII